MAQNPDDVDKASPFSKMSHNLQKLVKAVGFASFEGMGDDEQQIYSRVQQGKCMTCGTELGLSSNFIVTRHGIVGGYCGGQCHSDMAVLGFLQEQHDDITTSIDFRGKGHPQADEVPSDGKDR